MSPSFTAFFIVEIAHGVKSQAENNEPTPYPKAIVLWILAVYIDLKGTVGFAQDKTQER